MSPASVHFSQSQPQSLNLSNLENKKRSPEFNGKDGNISKKQKLCNVQRKKVVDKSGTSSNKSETAKDKDNIVCEFANVMRIDVAYEKALVKLKAIILAQVNKDCPNSTILQQRYLSVVTLYVIIIMYNMYVICLCLFIMEGNLLRIVGMLFLKMRLKNRDIILFIKLSMHVKIITNSLQI